MQEELSGADLKGDLDIRADKSGEVEVFTARGSTGQRPSPTCRGITDESGEWEVIGRPTSRGSANLPRRGTKLERLQAYQREAAVKCSPFRMLTVGT